METMTAIYRTSMAVATYAGALFVLSLFVGGNLYCRLRRQKEEPDWLIGVVMVAFVVTMVALAVMACAAFVIAEMSLNRFG